MRQTCTRCSQRRQRCDRKEPCTRCVQNGEGHLCATKWAEGYNPSIHRKYPKKVSPNPTWQPAASSSETGSLLDVTPPGQPADNQSDLTGGILPSHLRTPIADPNQSSGGSVWHTKLPEISMAALLSEKDQQDQQSIFNQGYTLSLPKSTSRDWPTVTNYLSSAARSMEIQHIQSLLPSKATIIQITDYYEHYR